ncbi:MAG TPA: response regulator transcription factor [Bacteroidales bacterium]|nr:response regulator transcription factor [Bacteroidales bacterium]
MKRKVLYVEDEPFLGKIVRETLENQNFEVLWKTTGINIVQDVRSFSPGICVLDIMLPDVDGYQLCRQIKQRYPTLPVIFLTAKTETADLVKGFEAGGTDYMRKPFSIEELIVRIHNQFQRMEGKSIGPEGISDEITFGMYHFHPGRCELVTPSVTVKLSLREMQVISLFTNHINRVVDRKMMLISIWGDDSFFNSRTLDVYIRKLRNYFSEDKRIEIVTMKGKGYLFLVPEK